jgi:hypothetical protein
MYLRGKELNWQLLFLFSIQELSQCIFKSFT